jgi:RHS repeat-associated protein
MKSVATLICCIFISLTIYAQEEIHLNTNSAEKYNKRGFYKNENLALNGNEIVSDYDGNLMVNYSTRINLPSELSGDFTVTYNTNVDHRAFDLDYANGGDMINSPEWIMGFKGIALQTLNFETNFFTSHQDPYNYAAVHTGEEIALLIPGYHYGNSINLQHYDFFSILRADGSKIVLQNVKDYAVTGLYKEVGFDAKGFAIVENYYNPDAPSCNNYRKIWYKPGDGFTYVFEEKRVNYNGMVDYDCNNLTRALYLTEIYSPGSYKYGGHLQFLYVDPPSDPSNGNVIYGRKLFEGIKVTPNNGSTLNYKGSNSNELEVFYGYNGTSLLNIQIFNLNLNKKLTLNTSAPSGSSVSLFSKVRDKNSMRKLNVISITDDLSRRDVFSYYGWTADNICWRDYLTAHENVIEFKFPLLKEINYHTGKSSKFNYYANKFTGYSSTTLFDFDGVYNFIYDNRDQAYRDCFTNFMLKSHEVWNKFNGISNLSNKEVYSYSFDKIYGQGSVNGIKTTVEEYEGSSKVSTQIKNYSNFRTNKSDLNASDFEYVVKLMSERVTEEVNIEEDAGTDLTEVEKDYTYADGGTVDILGPCFTGTFDMRTVKEIKKNITTSVSSERTDNISNEYDYASITYGDKSLVIPLKRSESSTDPNSLRKYTEYKNILPTSAFTNYNSNWNSPTNNMVYDNSEYFYMIGLPREEYLESLTKVHSDVVKEYSERGYLAGKLIKVTYNTKYNTSGTGNTNVDKQSYSTYSYMDNSPSYMSLLSSIENDKGARQDFYYPNTSNFQESIPGIIIKYDQSRTQTTFYHYGYQMQPFKTVTNYKNPEGNLETLTSYSSYNPDGTLQFTVDENSLHSAFAYDKVGRLISAALPGSFTTGTTSFSPNPGPAIDADPNHIVGTIVYTYDDANNTVTEKRRINSNPDPNYFSEVVSKQIIDGMGLSRQSSVLNDGSVFEVKGTDTYNSDGKILTHTDGENRTVTNSYDFLQRLTSQANGDGTSKNITYFVKPNTITNGSFSAVYSEYTRTTDEDNKEVYTYYDKVGNKVAEKVGTNPPTIFQYDSFYRLSKVISPEQRQRIYSYDELGNLRQKDSWADEGTTYYKYDKYKRLRFTMHKDAATYEQRGITFTKYDQFGRVLATGTLPSNYGWDALDPDKDYGTDQNLPHFENYVPSSSNADTANFVCVNMYDKYLKSGIFARMPDPFVWSQDDANSSRNLKGKLVLTAFRDKPGQGWNYRIYLYDYLGHVNHIFQKFGTSPWKLIAKATNVLNDITLENVYNVEGGSLVMEHGTWKNYDKQGRLVELRSDPAGNYSNSKVEATYAYNKADQCSTLTYNQVTNANKTTTYTYSTTRGWLNTIQNGSSNFYESLGYYYNGNIQSQTLTNSALGGTQSLSYSYDAMNRLTSVLQSGNPRESFQYDYDGNIGQRNYLSGGAQNSLYFAPSGNRISSIFTDVDEFSYYYDYRGNVNYDAYSGITDITYDHRNLPLSMTKSSVTSRYRYDDGGNRIYKDAQGNKEYYFRDDLGHEFAIFDITTDKLKTVNLYGSDLLGRIDLSWTSQYDYEIEQYVWSRTDSRKYYVKDHLGSIRQTLSESGAVMSAMDYYAFGGTMSSYINGSTVDKYKFTGKERDSETGLDYFGARYFDSKYGRWMSVDPLAEKYPGLSPYNYSLNNPINLYDPNGEAVFIANVAGGKTPNGYNPKIRYPQAGLIWIQNVQYKDRNIMNVGYAKNQLEGMGKINGEWGSNGAHSAPKVAEYLNNNNINVAIAQNFSVDGLKNSNGNIILGEHLWTDGAGNLGAVFLHEVLHLMGANELLAYAGQLAAGYGDFKKFMEQQEAWYGNLTPAQRKKYFKNNHLIPGMEDEFENEIRRQGSEAIGN